VRRRLTIAAILLVLATVVVSTVGTFVLVRSASVHTAEQELSGQAASIAGILTGGELSKKATVAQQVRIFARAGHLAGASLVVVRPDGSLRGRLPAGVLAADLDLPALTAGEQVTGRVGRTLLATGAVEVFSAVPAPGARAANGLPVLVVTRMVPSPANGVGYFVLVGLGALAVATVLAAVLGRRFARPVVAAAEATRRIAAGDLEARVPEHHGDGEELVDLARSVNWLGAELARVRDQERQFLLSVSHELRTPLTSISGYAEAVLDGTAPDQRAAVGVIRDEAARLDRLVGDLLELARIDARRFRVDARPVDLGALVGRTVDGLRPTAAAAGVSLTVSGPAESGGPPVHVVADPDRLAQMVANLVGNALDFATSSVVVTWTGGPAPSITVVDDGPGIPADELPHVFERHYTSDRQRRRRAGTGLGLAIVAELGSAMGIAVTARAPVTPAGGTAMELRFAALGGAPAAVPVG
jgi:two-component system sensor histidine kinase BaeS